MTGYAGQPQARHHNTITVGGIGQGNEGDHDVWQRMSPAALDAVRITNSVSLRMGSSSKRRLWLHIRSALASRAFSAGSRSTFRARSPSWTKSPHRVRVRCSGSCTRMCRSSDVSRDSRPVRLRSNPRPPGCARPSSRRYSLRPGSPDRSRRVRRRSADISWCWKQLRRWRRGLRYACGFDDRRRRWSRRRSVPSVSSDPLPVSPPA
jgi:hypothetical protein